MKKKMDNNFNFKEIKFHNVNFFMIKKDSKI